MEERDVKEIRSKARLIVKEYEGLLNLISNNQMYDTEIEEIIKNSLDPNNGNKIFKNEKVIIEDDLNPDLIARRRNTEIGSYLSNFNLQYVKTSDFSVSFDNIELSDVYFKDHYFLIATVDRIFKSTYGKEGKTYEPLKRAIEMEVFRASNGKWAATITSIIAVQPNLFTQLASSKVEILPSYNPILSLSNDLESTGSDSGMPLVAVGYDEEYYSILRNAEKAFNEERYDDAIQLFEQARAIKSYDSYNTLMLGRSKRLFDVQNLNTKSDLMNLYFRQAMAANAKGEIEIAIGRNKKILMLEDNKAAQKSLDFLEARLRAKEDVDFLLTLPADKKLVKEISKKTRGKNKNIEYELGVALVMRKMYEQSRNSKELKPILEPLDILLKKEPEFVRARVQRAEIFTLLSDYKNAIKDFNYLIDKNNNEYLFYVERGRRHLLNGNVQAAITDFGQANTINSNAPDGHFELGKIYLETAVNFEEAEFHFRQCIKAQYANPIYHYYYALAVKNTDALRGLEHLKIARELDNESALEKQIEREISFAMQIAETFMYRDSLDFATEIVEKALEVNNNSISALLQKSIMLKNDGNFQEAIPILERLLATNPNNSKIQYELAQNYSLNGKFEQSFQLFSKLIKSLEDSKKRYMNSANWTSTVSNAYDLELEKSYRGLADLFFKYNQFNEAIDYYMKSKNIARRDEYPVLMIAKSYLALGQQKEAANYVAEGLRINPINTELFYIRGLINYSQEYFSNSISSFTQALTNEKLKDNCNYYLGMAYYRDGNFSEALKHLRQVRLNSEFSENSLEYGFLASLSVNSPEDIRYFLTSLERIDLGRGQKNKFESLSITKKLFENSLDESEAILFLRNEPNNARVLYALAVLNFKKNSKDNAYNYLERALRTKQLYKADLYLFPQFENFEDRRVNKIIKDYL
ncbi:tetratricopeptide repeat protein [Mongoliitalea lutea]|uniref:Tetratricopeptide repeat-containing protein n=1 Tax=Mongoliitalea lutea TaxID=849756 RepID=A0A8J3CX37_9BACT|nr:tetratricopeptide repeat protein [Mongoliitalea lutea]GHB29409.1 hypothetical protein GCM10008106_07930 [Mongoliitalea lutea]